MNIPTRVQRSRKAGSRQPEGTRYCGRGSIYGNEIKIGNGISREDAIDKFERILQSLISLNGWKWFCSYYLDDLFGYKHLSCFCGLDKRCHVDIWIKYLKRREAELEQS